MNAAEQFLVGVTLRRWLERDDGLVATVRDALLEVLPTSFTPCFTTGNVDHGLPFVIHQPTALGFYVVFGSRCVFGLSQEECDALGRVGDDEYWEVARPVLPLVEVDVAPFLVSERILDAAWIGRLGLNPSARGKGVVAVTAALGRHGLRLPNEGELCVCWRLEQLGAERALPGQLWEGMASELAPEVAGRPRRAEPSDAPRWVSWAAGPFSEARWPERLVLSAPEQMGFHVRPVVSLLRDDVAWSDAGVAARAAEPPFTWRP
jgi:hypothetical protein